MAILPGPKRKIAKAAVEPRDAAPWSASGGEAGVLGVDDENGGIPNAAVSASASGGFDTKEVRRGAQDGAAAASVSGGFEFETKKVRGGVQAAGGGGGSDSGGLNSKKPREDATTVVSSDSGDPKAKKVQLQKGEQDAAGVCSDSGCLNPKKPREDAQAAAAGSDSGGPKAKTLQDGAAADLSRKKTEDRVEEDPGASSSPGINEPEERWHVRELSTQETSFFSHLLDCCGLITLLTEEDLEIPHVGQKKTPISQAKSHYNISNEKVEELSMYYSSFRVVRGDGECFYRSFIYSYLDHILDRDDTREEDRVLCATEKVLSAYKSLKWPYDSFYEYYNSFKELIQKVKGWKVEAKTVRNMRLLTFFGDYKESEHTMLSSLDSIPQKMAVH